MSYYVGFSCGSWNRCEDDALPNIKWVLDLARAAVLRHGVRGLVIDHYNELDHQRPPNM
jgi:twinkle protein